MIIATAVFVLSFALFARSAHLEWSDDLPLLNPHFDELVNNAKKIKRNGIHLSDPVSYAGRLLPKNLWVAFRYVPPPEHMYPHMKAVIEKNKVRIK